MWKKDQVFALVIWVVVTLPTPASAWDYPGHRIVGAIADAVLQRDHPTAYARVSELLDQKFGAVLDKRTLSEVAVFPDCAKNEKEYCGRAPSPEEVDYVLRNVVHDPSTSPTAPCSRRRISLEASAR